METTSRKKLFVVGNDESGKHSLLAAFQRYKIEEKGCFPTLSDNVVDVNVDGKLVELKLWPTCGEKYNQLRALSYPDTDVMLMCFSVDSPDSLEDIPNKWIPEVKHFCPNIPIILVGNKKDLRYEPRNLEKAKQEFVKLEDCLAMAQRIKAYAFYSTLS